MMTKTDVRNVTIIGAAVGFFAQFIVANIQADLMRVVPITDVVLLRAAIFVFFLVLAPLALWVADLIARWIPVVFQIAKFAAVGSLNSFVDIGVLNLLIYITEVNAGFLYTVFAACAWLLAVTNSFFWNKLWTFGAKGGNAAAQALKFYVITALVGMVNVGVASFVVNVLPRPDTISPNLWANVGKLAGIFTAMTFNFLAYKFVVFKDNASASAPTAPPAAPAA